MTPLSLSTSASARVNVAYYPPIRRSMITTGEYAENNMATYFNMLDVMMYTMEWFDLITMVRFSCTCKTHKKLASRVLNSRRYMIIRRFLTVNEDVVNLWSLLKSTGAVISGSSALAMITPHCEWDPKDLNVVVPRGTASVLLEFFFTHGYDFIEAPVSVNYRAGTIGHWIGCCMTNTVTVSESSEKSILPVVLGSDTTSRMNFCTWNGIFSLYPVLAAERLAFTKSETLVVSDATYASHRERRINIVDNAKLWRVPCGGECAAIWRRLRGGRGIGQFGWNSDGGLLDTLGSLPYQYKWRLRQVCDNPACPNNPGYARYLQS